MTAYHDANEKTKSFKERTRFHLVDDAVPAQRRRLLEFLFLLEKATRTNGNDHLDRNSRKSMLMGGAEDGNGGEAG